MTSKRTGFDQASSRPLVAKDAAPDERVQRLERIIGVVCGLGAATIWGGSSVVSRYLVTTHFDAFELTLLRYAACFPAALAIFVVLYPRLVNTLDWRQFAVLMVLAGPPFHFLVIAGYAYVPAGLGAVLIAGLLAVFTTMLGVFMGRAAPSPAQMLELASLLVGLGCLSVQLHGQGTGSSGHWGAGFGISIFALAALLWALLNHLIMRWRVDPLAMTINLALLSPVFMPIYLMVPSDGAMEAPLFDVVLQLIYHGLFVALGATFLFFAAVRRLGAEPAAVMLALAPALAVLFGWLFLGEVVMVTAAAGILLVLMGFLASLTVDRRLP